MSDLSKQQEQAIARSTMYLFAAILTILMVSLAGLFLSAELEQQAQNKEARSVQISRQPDVTPQSQRPWTRWKQQRPAMFPVKIHGLLKNTAILPKRLPFRGDWLEIYGNPMKIHGFIKKQSNSPETLAVSGRLA